MARLEEVLPAFRAGKEIRRLKWVGGGIDRNGRECLDAECLTADDWEIVPDESKLTSLREMWLKIENGGEIMSRPAKVTWQEPMEDGWMKVKEVKE